MLNIPAMSSNLTKNSFIAIWSYDLPNRFDFPLLCVRINEAFQNENIAYLNFRCKLFDEVSVGQLVVGSTILKIFTQTARTNQRNI